MKLNKLRATFGKLDSANLELGAGLNVITAPNEGGKSTWAGFLLSMLYGIDTRDRDKKGYLADKNRYQPWSGKPMVGEIDLTWGGRDITLRRSAKGNSPFAAFSATYTGTEATVDSLTDQLCGFVLTGVEREVYERSAFLGAGSHGVTSTPQLERRIAALVATGEEEISFSQVENRLKEWGRLRRVNKSVGLIPKLEGELEGVKGTLSQLSQLTVDMAATQEERIALEAVCAQLEREVDHHHQWANQQKNQKSIQAKEALDIAQHQLDTLQQSALRHGPLPSRERLRHWQGELAVLKSLERELREGEVELEQSQLRRAEAKKEGEDIHFGGLLSADALGLAQRETATYIQSGEKLAKLRRRPLFYTLFAALGGLLLAGATMYYGLPPYIPGGGGGLLAVLWIGGILAARSGQGKLSAQMAAILERYHIADIGSLSPLAEDYVARQQRLEEAETAFRQLSEHRRIQGDKVDSLQIRLMEFVHGFAPEVTSLIGCSAALSRALQMEEELAVAETKVAGAKAVFQARQEEASGVPAEGEVAAPTRPIHEVMDQHAAAQQEHRRVEERLAGLLGRQQASGDPAALEAQREILEEEIGRRQGELEAILTALNALQQANIRLQERFSPQINAKAGAYLTYLTQGSYDTVALNRELEGMATQTGDISAHSALYLSNGTYDQLYFAVRLAVCDLCLPQDEPAPLVLDDALAAFDQARMERALDLLCQLAERRQIILFSCHRREREYLQGRENVTCIEI